MRARVAFESAVGIFAQQRGAAAVGPDHAHQHLDRRRLAGAVAAQQAVNAAVRHAEVERIDDPPAAVVFRESLGDDRVGHGIVVSCAVLFG